MHAFDILDIIIMLRTMEAVFVETITFSLMPFVEILVFPFTCYPFSLLEVLKFAHILKF